MRISDFAIRNYQFTIVIFFLLAAIGFNAYRDIPRTEDPYFPISAFVITTIYPGADPAEMERQVTKPLEDALNELDDVKEMNSFSNDSVGVLRVEFHGNVDVEKKYDELNREIAALRPKLPQGVSDVTIRKINPGLVNIVQIALVSETASYSALADAAEELQDRLETIPGVRKSQTWAYPERELRVALNLKRMAELHLRVRDVLAVVTGENTNIPGGPVEIGGRRFNLNTTGNYKDIDEVRNTVIGGGGGRLIHVSDVADVSWDYQPEEYTARYDGKRAVFVTANQKDGQNIFKTQAAVEEILKGFTGSLPADIHLERGFEQSRNVEKRLTRLNGDFLIAVVLVLVTLLPLGLRAAGIVMVSIPLSLATGLAAIYFAGFSLNQLSIAGFVVALGLLVDDSIVVIENIARFQREGHSRREAAIQGTRQISLAVLGCTATLLFAFLPLLMLPGNAGKFIRSLPVTVLFTVLASLFVALTIIPFLASRFLPAHETAEGNRVLRTIMNMIHGIYAPLLRRALHYPYLTVGISMLLFVGSLALVPVMGLSVFPKADTPQFMIMIHLPNGSSLQRTNEVLKEVEARLRKHPEVVHALSNLGRGNPQIYYNIFQHEYAANYAEVFAQVDHYDAKATPKLMDQLRHEFDRIPGVEILVKEFENGPPLDAPIAIRVVGPEIDTLRSIAAQMEQIISSTPGTQNVVNPQRRGRMDLKLNVKSERAGMLGVQSAELDQAVRLAVVGLPAGDFKVANGDSYPVMLRAPMDKHATLAALDGLHVSSITGEQVPLSQLAKLEFVDFPDNINRYNRQRAVEITAYNKTGYNTEALTNQILKKLDKINLPSGYRFVVAGDVKGRKESFAGFGTAILVTVFGIMAILILEFGSFKSTLIVATVIPLGVTGGLTMLFLSGYSLSFTAMIGFIALIGIEIKNSILLVDLTNQLRKAGKALDEAIEEAGQIRFLPILLTSATAAGGLLPLALQKSGLYSPMAWVIIGGLITSTLIGRLVTPVMYKLLPPAELR